MVYCEARGSAILLHDSLNHFGIVSEAVLFIGDSEPDIINHFYFL